MFDPYIRHGSLFLEPVQAADLWQYGGFVDVGYLQNFNHPDNHLWRSKQTYLGPMN